MISSPWQVYVQKVGIFGAQTILVDAFDATYYLANHGPLERSVNLVLQGFTYRHTHFRMHILLSLYCNSFAYIEEKRWKLYVHPNWKHLSTLDSKPFCLGRLPRALGGFSYASKTTALTPSGIRELSFLMSALLGALTSCHVTVSHCHCWWIFSHMSPTGMYTNHHSMKVIKGEILKFSEQ